MKRLLIISLLCCLTCGFGHAQLNFRQRFEKRMADQRDRYENKQDEQQKKFDEFRRKQNESYVGKLRQRWIELESNEPLQPKEINRVVQMEYIDSTISSTLNTENFEILSVDTHLIPDTTNVIPADTIPGIKTVEDVLTTVDSTDVMPKDELLSTYEDVVFIPQPQPQPQPMVPIVEPQLEHDIVSVALYGTLTSVAMPKDADLHLQTVDEYGIATLWEQIADTVVPSRFDITIVSCLKNREEMNLCDWAYLKMVQTVAKRRYGNTNEATIFAAYIMAQSGYKIRMAFTESYVYMLLASHHEIYGMSRYMLDDEWYYVIEGRGEKTCFISDVGYQNEKKFSLYITDEQKIDSEVSDTIIATSRKGWSLPIQANINLIEFYDEYPAGRVFHGDESSKWLVGVNTPLDPVTKDILYPHIQEYIKDMSPWQAVTMILNWVQTAFNYEKDDVVWGQDRIFFATETLYYPFSDCEDRAILFTTLVRDLIGLDVVLLYYNNPGHLATAVHFPVEEAEGEYVIYDNKRYVICDPTFKNAPIGKKMTTFQGVQAQLIVID